jgi:hypothetical protein
VTRRGGTTDSIEEQGRSGHDQMEYNVSASGHRVAKQARHRGVVTGDRERLERGLTRAVTAVVGSEWWSRWPRRQVHVVGGM